MLNSKILAVLVLSIAVLALNGCAAAYVGSKAVGAVVDVSTGAVSLAARGTMATGRAVAGVVTGDDCEAEETRDDDRDNAHDDEDRNDDEEC